MHTYAREVFVVMKKIAENWHVVAMEAKAI